MGVGEDHRKRVREHPVLLDLKTNWATRTTANSKRKTPYQLECQLFMAQVAGRTFFGLGKAKVLQHVKGVAQAKKIVLPKGVTPSPLQAHLVFRSALVAVYNSSTRLRSLGREQLPPITSDEQKLEAALYKGLVDRGIHTRY